MSCDLLDILNCQKIVKATSPSLIIFLAGYNWLSRGQHLGINSWRLKKKIVRPELYEIELFINKYLSLFLSQLCARVASLPIHSNKLAWDIVMELISSNGLYHLEVLLCF